MDTSMLWRLFFHVATTWKLLFTSSGSVLLGTIASITAVALLFISGQWKGIRAAFYPLFALGLFFLMLSIKNGEPLADWNYTIVYPIILFIVAVIFDRLFLWGNKWGKGLAILCGILMLLALADKFSSTIGWKAFDLKKTSDVARSIYEDSVNQKTFPKIYVSADNPTSGTRYESYVLWYFFERYSPGFIVFNRSQQRLGQSMRGDGPYYLACEGYNEAFQQTCLQTFSKDFPQYKKGARIISQHDDTTTYVFE